MFSLLDCNLSSLCLAHGNTYGNPELLRKALLKLLFQNFNSLGNTADNTMADETDGTLLPWDKAMLLLAPPPKQPSIVSPHAGWYHIGPHPELPVDQYDGEVDFTEEGDHLLGHTLICKVFIRALGKFCFNVHLADRISVDDVRFWRDRRCITRDDKHD